MKAKITKIDFVQEIETKHGTMYKFNAHYNGKVGSFLSKKREQSSFKEGEEAEFTETSREYNGTTYFNIKKVSPYGQSNFNRRVKQEQSKYSGFAMSYAKDLVVAGKINETQMFSAAKKMLDWMVEQDKQLANA